MLKKELGIRVKNIRESMNLSKEEFARQLGVSGQYLGVVERGKSCLSVEKIERLCQISHLSADFILFGRDPNFTESTIKLLSKYSKEQIVFGCEALEQLALFIKSLQ